MRISVVTKYFSPSIGGGERQLQYFLTAMQGHAEIDVFTAQNSPQIAEFMSHVTLHKVPRHVTDLNKRIEQSVREALRSRNTADVLYLIAYQKAAVPAQVSLLRGFSQRGVPTIVRFSSLGEASAFVSHSPEPDIFKHISRVLCLSPSIADEMKKLGCPENRLFTFINPIDLSAFPLSRGQKASRKRKFLVLSRPHSKKNWARILEAWAAADVGSSQLSFVYSDNGTAALSKYVEEMKRFAQSLRPKSPVFFIKTDKFADVPNLLSDHDVMISASENEGMQNSLLEGLAYGLSLLVPKEPDFAFLPTGFATFYETNEALVRHIRELAEQPPNTSLVTLRARVHLAREHGLENYHDIASF